ncbi:hypothetical protein HPP92_025990 [Vanilla planifolia]|uniref:Glycosyltransferase n=1 Tax=Vanilla planifolia TaxID=51239 RepID=A0A835UBJ8_VANPL|nr:hypothetical protein HPP92_025990 [Vanilla planifolia]
MEQERQHIVMLPFMAQGHFIPFLSLARLILRRHPSSTITIVNTPLNILSLRSFLPPDDPSYSPVHFASLPFASSDHNLPPNTESSDSLPGIDSLPLLMLASESLSPHFDRFLSSLDPSPLLLLADIFTSWSLPIARRLQIPAFTFSTCGAFGTASFSSLWLHLPHRLHPESPSFPVPGFPPSFRLHRSQMSHYMRVADGHDAWSTFLRRQIRLCFSSAAALLCNTVAEVEPSALRLVGEICQLPVLTVGPLVDSGHRSGREPGIGVAECVEWLGAHRPASVLYISFGSQNTIGAAQMMALAEGVEASGVPFIWVVRTPAGFDMTAEFEAERWLPEGFEERAAQGRRGLVVPRWAPQVEILSHGAIGGFLTHCGWNSVQESLSRGVPMIGWPLASEQFYNSMVIEEIGVAVEVARGVQGDVDARKVERVVRMLMQGEKGREMKEKAARCEEMMMAAVAEDGEKKGSSLRAVEEMFEMAYAMKQDTAFEIGTIPKNGIE